MANYEERSHGFTYDVFLSFRGEDVRYGKAMVAHQKRFGKESEKIKAWTAALSKVPNLKGHHHHIHNGHEIDHVKEIAGKDMGREIVEQEAPNNPAKRSRLWFHQDVIDVLSSNDSGSDAIQGIIQLSIKKPFEQFLYLTVMNFSNNQSMKTMPDVSKVEYLRELRLDRCFNLTTVHESIGFLKHLIHLSASSCTKLVNFPHRMFLPSLEVLDLNRCFKLEHFPDIVNKMNKPLKIHMSQTSIKKLPNSVGNLIGLVSIDMTTSFNLKYLPSSLFRLPNVVALKFELCNSVKFGGESFRRFLLDSPSEANEHSTLKTVYFSCSGLSDEDIHTILICFPKLQELIVPGNNLVSLPACIKESNHLTNLDVSLCEKLQKIPECTNLRNLDVSYCSSLTHISELPCTIQKIDARHCFNLSSETSNMLWDQVKKERHGLVIVMPSKIKVPKWFDYSCKGGIPCLWVRRKFPINIALALVFRETRYCLDNPTQLNLVINGQSVRRIKNNIFYIQSDHVLVCDLRLIYNDEEWLSIDALFLKHEWNQVQISYESKYHTETVSQWGVFVYKQGTDNLEEHVQFTCPNKVVKHCVKKRKKVLKHIEELAFDEIPEPGDEIRDKPHDKVTMFQTMKLLVFSLKLFLIRVGIIYS
ncbi:hypothetical protein P8452_49344 [Trifolium repens]|nr:hypothetical protein P8452_49344 [Trifolium repens]